MKAKIGFLILVFLALAALEGCSTTRQQYGDESDYSQNLFYMQQAEPPSHPGKDSDNDFFNKVCEPSGGHSSYSGREFDCHYTN